MIKRFYDADKVDTMLREWQLKFVSVVFNESTEKDMARSCGSAYAMLEVMREKLPDTIVKIRIKD